MHCGRFWKGQIKDYKIGICCPFTRKAALKSGICCPFTRKAALKSGICCPFTRKAALKSKDKD